VLPQSHKEAFEIFHYGDVATLLFLFFLFHLVLILDSLARQFIHACLFIVLLVDFFDLLFVEALNT
jgi:hypothetical protein